MNGKAAFLLGSESDKETVEVSRKYFDYFDIELDLRVMSAHRNPDDVSKFATSARDNGYHVLIGAAGMAAHLAGALKAHSTLPVIGVPLAGGIEDGLDAGKAGAINAAILTAEILSLNNTKLSEKLTEFKRIGSKL